MDLRFLALGAILPDLIDLPIGVAMWSTFQTPRLAAHSILFGAIAMVAVLILTRRGPRRKRWMLLAVGLLIHVALDAMWQHPETLWWPFLGTEFSATEFATYGAYVGDLVRDPLMWAGELAGFAYLAVLWKTSGLRDIDARRRLASSGVVDAPIERG
ncbi:MAG: metal-dependent hydrolase [Acidimicrobiia bacterium]